MHIRLHEFKMQAYQFDLQSDKNGYSNWGQIFTIPMKHQVEKRNNITLK